MKPVVLWAALLAAVPVASLAQTAPPPSAVAVDVQRFGTLVLSPQREAPASVLARNEAKVAAEVSGPVRRWTVDVGASVVKGTLLVELDPADFQLARERAQAAVEGSQARLRLAEAQLRRARELVAQGFLSEEALAQRDTEVQLLRTELAVAQNQLATAARQLAKTRITAPFAASVKQRFAQTGEYVSPGTTLYVLVELGAAEISAQLAFEDVASLKASPHVVFDGPGGPIPVRLLRVARTVTAPARTVEARLGFTPAPSALPVQPVPPGTEGRLRWTDPRPHVPAALLVRRVVDGRSQLGVFVVESTRAKFMPLPGAQEGRAAVATLPAQAQVVVRGQAALSDGQTVRPNLIERAAPAAPAGPAAPAVPTVITR